MSKLLDSIDKSNVPRHIGVIMDGNGRWATKRGLDRTEGHKAGAKVIERLMDAALELNIECVSLYTFSTENWSRPVYEVKALWELLIGFFEEKLPVMIEKKVRIVHSGFEKKLPAKVLNTIREAQDRTAKNRGMVMNFCLNYGSRQEMIQAFNLWDENRKPGEKLTEKKFEKFLDSSGLPDVDLMIRTSGEQRISNFMLWQNAYAEFIFMKVLWPDFKANDLYKAVIEYQKRNRRYGGL